MVSSDDLNLMTDDLRLETFLLVGTDTGVGKTIFSGFFTQYLMDNGVGGVGARNNIQESRF